jgi:hypothetical protein
MTSAELSREALYYLLGWVLVEIRAIDDLVKAQILADIFHNVPAKLCSGNPEEDIVAEILEKAARHEWEKRILRMLDVSAATRPKYS